MRRIVNLISHICASGPQTTLQGAADVAVAALANQFPSLGAVLVERDVRQPGTLRVIAGKKVPAAWRARRIPLAEVPLIAEAFHSPQEATKGSLRSSKLAGGRVSPRRGRQVVCGAVPAPDEVTHAVVLFGSSLVDLPTRIAAVDVVRRMLAFIPVTAGPHPSGAAGPHPLEVGGAHPSGTFAAIVEAKQEWERTADALPELVGLVDRCRNIVRINRALERWSLGTVQDAIGRNVHRVLHPHCMNARCDLNLLLEDAFGKLATAGTATFEFADPVRETDLVVVLKTTADTRREVGESGWNNAALIVSNVSSLRRAERELKVLNRALEQRVADRTARLTNINRALRDEIARHRATLESLRESKLELEALSDRLVTAQESERKRIAQDLHDSVGQGMSAIKYSLERASLLAGRDETDQAVRVVDKAIERTQAVIDEVRAISMNLRPAVLDDLGAVSAIRCFCRDWREVYNNVIVKADIAVTDQDIPAAIITSVYRAVQECLNNVAAHAQARRVWVSIRIADGNLVVKIRDDGLGFRVDAEAQERPARPASLGLRGLRERTERSGGCCRVTSSSGKGTTVRLEWPIVGDLAARNEKARLN